MKSVVISNLAQNKEKLYKNFCKRKKAILTSSSVQLNTGSLLSIRFTIKKMVKDNDQHIEAVKSHHKRGIF